MKNAQYKYSPIYLDSVQELKAVLQSKGKGDAEHIKELKHLGIIN